jgi:glucan 1,3-beta-glucosidase
MRTSSTFLLAVCALVAAAHVTNSNQVPLGFSDRDGQKPITPSKYWYESILHNGEASFMPSSYKPNYSVFRNVVTDYGADNTGHTDAAVAIQNAINGM